MEEFSWSVFSFLFGSLSTHDDPTQKWLLWFGSLNTPIFVIRCDRYSALRAGIAIVMTHVADPVHGVDTGRPGFSHSSVLKNVGTIANLRRFDVEFFVVYKPRKP
jgi:hypothetical protein